VQVSLKIESREFKEITIVLLILGQTIPRHLKIELFITLESVQMAL